MNADTGVSTPTAQRGSKSAWVGFTSSANRPERSSSQGGHVMKSRWLNVTHRGAFLAFLGLTLLGLGSTRADEADPPGRVARLSDVEGSVSLQPAGVQDWAAATLNRPLTTGDRLWADQDARAELDMGDAALRLGATTGFSFLNLDDHTAQMQLTAGTLLVHVRNIQPNQTYEIDTPNVALSLQQPAIIGSRSTKPATRPSSR